MHLPFDDRENETSAITTDGSVEIKLKPTGDNVKEFQFHARTATNRSSGYLIFSENDVVLLRDNQPVIGTKVEFQPATDIVFVTTNEPLNTTSYYMLKVKFTGNISAVNENQGLYRSYYLVRPNNTDAAIKRHGLFSLLTL